VYTFDGWPCNAPATPQLPDKPSEKWGLYQAERLPRRGDGTVPFFRDPPLGEPGRTRGNPLALHEIVRPTAYPAIRATRSRCGFPAGWV